MQDVSNVYGHEHKVLGETNGPRVELKESISSAVVEFSTSANSKHFARKDCMNGMQEQKIMQQAGRVQRKSLECRDRLLGSGKLINIGAKPAIERACCLVK
eukprot:1157556-Pelagomonas_calceolata.AAC.12